MKYACFLLCSAVSCLLLIGCQAPAAPAPGTPGGPKLSDVRDTSLQLKNADFLITFKVFPFTIDPNLLPLLDPLYQQPRAAEIYFRNAAAFEANGIAVLAGPRERLTAIARALNNAGASRIAQNIISVPPAQTDAFSSVPFYQPRSLYFLTDKSKLTSRLLYPGFVGWTLFAESSAVRDMILLRIAPAYWQTGAEDIRLRFGKEPINYEPFEFAAFHLRLKEGDFILLAPSRISDQTNSLNRALFLETGKRPLAKCFVIVCESAGL